MQNKWNKGKGRELKACIQISFLYNYSVLSITTHVLEMAKQTKGEKFENGKNWVQNIQNR